MKSTIYIFSILLFITISQSCSSEKISGNGKIISQEIAISDYKKLSIEGSATIIYTQEANIAPYFHIEVDENIMSVLDIDSSNEKLSVKPKDGYNVSPTKLIIRTNSTKLNDISIAGSIEMLLNDSLQSSELKINTAGSCTLIGSGNLTYNNISIDCAGSCNITLAGTCNDVQCSLAGSNNIDILSLQAKNVSCEIAGSNDLKTHAEESLKITSAGSCTVKYRGNPAINKKIAGSGEVIKID